MREILLSLLTLLAPACAFASDCTEMNGMWQATNQGNSMEYIYLNVGFEPVQHSLRIDYYYDANESIRSFSETYIADGRQHDGDNVFTGISYRASCENGAITIVRNVQELSNPLHTKLRAADRKLNFSSDNGGDSPVVTEIFVPRNF